MTDIKIHDKMAFLVYNLDSDARSDFVAAQCGLHLYSLLLEIDEKLRQVIKYNDYNGTTLSDDAISLAEEIRNMICSDNSYQLINEEVT